MKLLTQWAVTSSVLILIVLAARFLLRDKLSARLRYALWAVVLVRLLVPFQVTLPAAVSDSLPLLASNLAVVSPSSSDEPVFPGGRELPEDGKYVDIFTRNEMIRSVWRAGMLGMGAALLASNLRFVHRLRKRRRPLEVPDCPLPVYEAECLPSPCLFGLFRPAVYVTPQAAENPAVLRHVLAHELTHYAHRDHIWSLLRCLALALHWYNPLVWLAVVLSKGDGELACDEGAVARLGEEERIPYGRTLVDMVAKRSARPADLLSCSTAMTGGNRSMRERVLWLVKKPETVKTALFAAVAVMALAAVFVFAGRGGNSAEQKLYDEFLAKVEAAQSISVSDTLISSTITPSLISEPELLEQAKELLLSGEPTARLDEDGQEGLEKMLFLDGHRLILDRLENLQSYERNHYYHLSPYGDGCALLWWDAEKDSVKLLALYPSNIIPPLKEMARHNRTIR